MKEPLDQKIHLVDAQHLESVILVTKEDGAEIGEEYSNITVHYLTKVAKA